jgi:hypothetical protein
MRYEKRADGSQPPMNAAPRRAHGRECCGPMPHASSARGRPISSMPARRLAHHSSGSRSPAATPGHGEGGPLMLSRASPVSCRGEIMGLPVSADFRTLSRARRCRGGRSRGRTRMARAHKCPRRRGGRRRSQGIGVAVAPAWLSVDPALTWRRRRSRIRFQRSRLLIGAG